MKEQRAKMKEQPTPNRGQSNLFELPRCEGGKDRIAGLKSKEGRGKRKEIRDFREIREINVMPHYER